MIKPFILVTLICFFSLQIVTAQKTNTSTKDSLLGENLVLKDTLTSSEIDPLRPAKAAFFSAVLPGLGQVYNKKYWKVPLVVGAIGSGIYLYTRNNRQFNRARDAYKRRLAGFTDDEFYGTGTQPSITNDGLIRLQKRFRRNQELSLLVTIGLYALNIIDANVDAHLMQFNVDENLSLAPHLQYNQMENTSDLGLTLNFNF